LTYGSLVRLQTVILEEQGRKVNEIVSPDRPLTNPVTDNQILISAYEENPKARRFAEL
jgi:hypothetical protein